MADIKCILYFIISNDLDRTNIFVAKADLKWIGA